MSGNGECDLCKFSSLRGYFETHTIPVSGANDRQCPTIIGRVRSGDKRIHGSWIGASEAEKLTALDICMERFIRITLDSPMSIRKCYRDIDHLIRMCSGDFGVQGDLKIALC